MFFWFSRASGALKWEIAKACWGHSGSMTWDCFTHAWVPPPTQPVASVLQYLYHKCYSKVLGKLRITLAPSWHRCLLISLEESGSAQASQPSIPTCGQSSFLYPLLPKASCLNQICYLQEPFKLLILDTLTSNFRTDFCGRGELAERQQKLGQMLSRLRKVIDFEDSF